MNYTQLRGQSRVDRSTGAPRRGVPGLGIPSRAQVAPVQRFCALVLAGLTILVSLADTSHAQSGNARKSNNKVQSGTLSPGIRDPMNPEAYMRDLAARMNVSGDQNLLLGGVSASKTGPAPAGPVVQGPPRVAPRAVPPQAAPGAASRPAQPATPTVPAMGIWSGTPSTGPVTPAAPSHPERVVPNTFATTPAPAGQTTPAAPSQPERVVTNAFATTPVPAGQTTSAVPSQPDRVVPNTFATTPAPAGQMTPATPEPPSEVVPAASAGVLSPSNQTPAAAPGQLIQFGAATSAGQLPATTPGQLIRGAPNVVMGTPAPAPQTTLIMPGQPVPLPPPSTAALIGSRASPAHPALSSSDTLFARGPGAVERQLVAGRPGLTLWGEPGSATQLTQGGAAVLPPPVPEGPWTLGGDLEKYRAHAVKDGSRTSGENLKKALERTGMTLGDGVNIFVLGYASDRAKPFRQNDGKGLLQEPGKVPAAAGATIGSLGVGLYSLADLLTLNALPDANTPAYKDNNPLVRPVVFAGRTVHGVWKTTEEVGNAVTWGLFDNVTGCIGLVIEDIVEVVKHAGEAVTNVARAPFHLAAGKKKIEGTDRALDWILLVPLELASNAVEMKGFANMQDYKTAFREKGVIGSVLEFGGSTYIMYRAVDELVDRHNNKHHKSQDQGQDQNPDGGSGGENPPEPPDGEVPVDTGSDVYFFWSSDGTPIFLE